MSNLFGSRDEDTTVNLGGPVINDTVVEPVVEEVVQEPVAEVRQNQNRPTPVFDEGEEIPLQDGPGIRAAAKSHTFA